MTTYADKTQESKTQTTTNSVYQNKSSENTTLQLVDNRVETLSQKDMQESINSSPRAMQLKSFQDMADNYTAQKEQPIQKKENNTGLPNNLKSGIENISGYSMNDVKVHYNSAKPAQLNAHAYAQGTDIHLGTGQEKHLPHEAWHVVQQKQGRVKATKQMKGTVAINDDAGLEKEADVMGAKALQAKVTNEPLILDGNTTESIQRMKIDLPAKVSTVDHDYEYDDELEFDSSSLIAAEISPDDPTLYYFSQRLEVSKTLFTDRPDILAEINRALGLINDPTSSVWTEAEAGKRVGGQGVDYASVKESIDGLTKEDDFHSIRYSKYADAIARAAKTFPTLLELSKYNKLKEYVVPYAKSGKDNQKILNIFYWLIPLHEEDVKSIDNKQSLMARMKIALKTEIEIHLATILGGGVGPAKALIRSASPINTGVENSAGVRSEIKTGFLGALKSGEKADSRTLETKLSQMEKKTFVAGHLVADTLGGKNASYNLAPMTNEFNTQGGKNGIKDPENDALKRLKNGLVIFYRTEVTYKNDVDPYVAIKPSSLEIRVATLNLSEQGDSTEINDYKTVSDEKVYKRTMI